MAVLETKGDSPERSNYETRDAGNRVCNLRGSGGSADIAAPLILSQPNSKELARNLPEGTDRREDHDSLMSPDQNPPLLNHSRPPFGAV